MQRAYGFTIDVDSGATSPGATVHVYDAGTLTPSTIYSDNISTPKANPFLSDASTSVWFFYAANGRYDVQISGTGITTYTLGDVVLNDVFTLNGLTTNVQNFAVGSAGTDFAISSLVDTHTFNIPSASATARGLVTTGAQTFAGAKTFSTPIAAGSGGTGTTAPTADGQVLIGSSGGTYTKATLTGTANQVTVTNGAGSITLSTPQSLGTGSSPSFTGLTVSGLAANRALLTTAGGQLTTAAAATDGQVLLGATGAAPAWASLTAGSGITLTAGTNSLSISAAAGISSINGLTGSSQTMLAGTSGTDFAVSSSGTSHTFNLPDASSVNRGVVTTGSQTFAGAKTLTGAFTNTSTTAAAFSNNPSMTAGSGTATGPVPGIINLNVSTVTVSGTAAETDLMTYTLPANSLNANGKGLRIWAAGTKTGTAGTTTYKLYYGANSVAIPGIGAGQAGGVWLTGTIIRTTGASAENLHAFSFVAAAGNNAHGTAATDTTANQTVKFTVTLGSAADSATLNSMIVETIN